jgi:cobalt/nickel transport system permease protein
VNIVHNLTALEKLAGQDGFFQRLHPAAKIGATFVYITAVVSFNRYALGQMTPYLLYPVIASILAAVPFSLSLRRLAPALPFCLFAGVSNILFEKETAFIIGGYSVSFGFISFFSLVFRTLLCVEAVILLVSTTPVYVIMPELRRFGLPAFLVTLLEMTYRYISVPVTEARSLRIAYQMRLGSHRGIDLRHTGSFIGSLFLRSMARTENISNAMKLRGYDDAIRFAQKTKIKTGDILFFLSLSFSCILFRIVNIPLVIGKLWYSLFM